MAAIAYNALHSNGRKSFEIGMSAKFISKSLSPKSYRHAMLIPIVIFLCLWLQAPVICPKSKKVDAVDKQPLNGFNRQLQNSHLPGRVEVT